MRRARPLLFVGEKTARRENRLAFRKRPPHRPESASDEPAEALGIAPGTGTWGAHARDRRAGWVGGIVHGVASSSIRERHLPPHLGPDLARLDFSFGRAVVFARSAEPSSGMAGGNRQLLLVGFTLVGGALGFYVEEKVEAYYKEERFKRFEAAVRARADSNVKAVGSKK